MLDCDAAVGAGAGGRSCRSKDDEISGVERIRRFPQGGANGVGRHAAVGRTVDDN